MPAEARVHGFVVTPVVTGVATQSWIIQGEMTACSPAVGCGLHPGLKDRVGIGTPFEVQRVIENPLVIHPPLVISCKEHLVSGVFGDPIV